MIIEMDFMGHWKTRALIAAIGRGEALQALILLWGHCQSRKAWEFELSPLKLAGICGFEGDAAKLMETMKELQWIDPAEEAGWFRVHGWGETNASLVGKWAGGARERGAHWHPRGYVVKADGSTPAGTTGGTIGGTTGSGKATSTGASSGSGSGTSSGGSDRIGEDGIGSEGRGKNGEGNEECAAGGVPPALTWSLERGWQGFDEAVFTELAQAYPACDIRRQLLAMEQWLKANPLKAKKSNWRRFVNNWLKAEQDRGGDLHTLSRPTGGGSGAPNAQKKEGGAPPTAKKIRPADFPWRAVAIEHEGWEPVGEWEDQTLRTRQTLRESWSRLSVQTKSALWALSQDGAGDEKKEAAAKSETKEAITGTPPDWREHFARLFGKDAVHPEQWCEVPPAMQRQVWADLEKRKAGAGAQ